MYLRYDHVSTLALTYSRLGNCLGNKLFIWKHPSYSAAYISVSSHWKIMTPGGSFESVFQLLSIVGTLLEFHYDIVSLYSGHHSLYPTAAPQLSPLYLSQISSENYDPRLISKRVSATFYHWYVPVILPSQYLNISRTSFSVSHSCSPTSSLNISVNCHRKIMTPGSF